MDGIEELLGNIADARALASKAAQGVSDFTEAVRGGDDTATAVIAILAQNAADTPGTDGAFSEADGTALLDFIAELGLQAGMLQLILLGDMMIRHDEKEKYIFCMTNKGNKLKESL